MTPYIKSCKRFFYLVSPFLVFFFFSCKTQEKVYPRSKEVVGLVTRQSYTIKSSQASYYEIDFKGKKYSNKSYSNLLAVNSKYIVRIFDTLNIKSEIADFNPTFEIKYNVPLIEDDDDIGRAIGYVKSTNEFGIDYYYDQKDGDGKTYKVEGFLARKNANAGIKKGDKFRVIFELKNPNSGIILIDEPYEKKISGLYKPPTYADWLSRGTKNANLLKQLDTIDIFNAPLTGAIYTYPDSATLKELKKNIRQKTFSFW